MHATKKINQRKVKGYAGLSKKEVLSCVTSNRKLRKFSIKFTNKAKPQTFEVKEIHEQHQRDLVDMKNMIIEHKGKLYPLKYFRCWICFLVSTRLCLLIGKKVAFLKKSDNGDKFKKHIKVSRKSYIEMFKCRLVIIQELECSDRAFRGKIYHNMK